jgi:hypothetical protein
MNRQPHRIRLQGPWEIAPPGDASSFQRIMLPDEVERLAEFPNGFSLRRRFHRPTGLSERDRLVLVLPASANSVRVTVNSVALTPHATDAAPSEWDLPPLELSNVVTITVHAQTAFEAWREPVTLEIHSFTA